MITVYEKEKVIDIDELNSSTDLAALKDYAQRGYTIAWWSKYRSVLSPGMKKWRDDYLQPRLELKE